MDLLQRLEKIDGNFRDQLIQSLNSQTQLEIKK